jgi:intracellular septation protein
MQVFAEIAPLLAFAITYYLRDLYAATAVLMAGMVALVAFDWLRSRRVPPLHALSAVLVLLFGTATLVLHDKHFIQWKPTGFFWLASAAFLGSAWIGRQTLTQRFLGAAFGERLQLTAPLWRRLNLWWTAFYALLGALNLLVAHYASERAWVQFKVFGLTALTLLFLVAQLAWLNRRNALQVSPP